MHSIPRAVTNQSFEGTWNKLLSDIPICFPKLASWARLNLNCIKPNSDRDCSSGGVPWFWFAKWAIGWMSALQNYTFPCTSSSDYFSVSGEKPSVQKAAHTPDSIIVSCLVNSVYKDYRVSEWECSETTQNTTADSYLATVDTGFCMLSVRLQNSYLSCPFLHSNLKGHLCFVVILNLKHKNSRKWRANLKKKFQSKI